MSCQFYENYDEYLKIYDQYIKSYREACSNGSKIPSTPLPPCGSCNTCDETTKWVQEPRLSALPPPRSSGQLVNANGLLFYWGGFYECFSENEGCDNIWYDDLYNYDLNKSIWKIIKPTSTTGKLPGARTYFGANYWKSGNVVVIFGGVKYDISLTDVTVYDDIWFYSMEKKLW